MRLTLLALAVLTQSLVLAIALNAEESKTDMAGAFVKTCKSNAWQDYCLGYVRGVSDLMDLGWVGGKPCVPGEVTNGQLLQIVTLYVDTHPKVQDYATELAEILALRGYFQCKVRKEMWMWEDEQRVPAGVPETKP